MSSASRTSFARRVALVVSAIVVVVLATRAYSGVRSLLGSGGERGGDVVLTAPRSVEEDSATASARPVMEVPDSLLGRSGALRFTTLTRAEAFALPGFLETFSEEAIQRPSARIVRQGADSFVFFTLRAFADKRDGFVNGYRLGDWPAERWLMARNYFNPDGFVEVMPANVSLPLSRHFVLGDFLTHDQQDIWPKYVVLEEKLIDKLELVLQDLSARGYSVDRAVLLSGFRAPYYNDRGVAEGMARASRHQYGDAADIFIDSDGDGRMDDLNRDRRVDLRDVQPITDAIVRVERRYPELVGGLGTYAAMGPRGPFAHVDVRGTSARWEREVGGRKSAAKD